MLDDLIRRKDAIDAIMGEYPEPHYPDWFADVVAHVPSAQPNVHDSEKDADCISRQALCEYALNQKDKSVTPNDIMRFPPAQPERKTGRWIRHIRTDLGPKLNDTIECSECRIAFPTENMFRRSFCPNCGSYNRGESNDQSR